MENNIAIRRRSLAEEVADRLRERIEAGRLAEGEKLPPEPELMKLFGVGRSTIREAARILENMGCLSVQQGRGTFVAKGGGANESFRQRLKRADIRELREVRDILETPIARLAAQRRTEADVESMKRYIRERRETAEAGDVVRCIAADIGFHNAVAGAAHNGILAELYRGMTVHLSSGYEYIYEDTSRLLETQSVHERLLRHIETGHAEAAVRAAGLLWKDTQMEEHDRPCVE